MFRRGPQEIHVTFSNRTILRVIAFIVGTIFAFRFFNNIRHPLTLIFVSAFLALALNPAVSWVTKRLKNKSRARGTAIAYLSVVTLLIVFFSVVIPPLVQQTTKFIRDVPSTISSIENQNTAIGRFVRNNNLEEQLQKFADGWKNNLGDVQGPVLSTANRVVANVVSIITVLVLTFMMLIEGPRYLEFMFDQVPKERRQHALSLGRRMYRVVTGYVNGQVIVALISAGFSFIAMVIMSNIFQVSINAIALAGIVFLFALIPTIGNVISALLVVFITLISSLPMAIALLVYFIVYQQIENVTIQPYIQSRNNEMSPMLIFIAALLGIGFGGLLGGFVAIPAAGCAKILFEDWLDDRLMNSSTKPEQA
jgi:predicted PurR-regulated permease PerM